MRFSLAVVVVVLMVATSAYAQTTSQPCPDACELKLGSSYSVGFTHDGKDTTGFRFYLREGTGAEAKVGTDIPLSALQNGAVLVPLPAPTRTGEYVITAVAYNSFFESRAAPLKFTVVGPPTAPGTPRIFYVAVSLAADGTVEFRVVDASLLK